jgi:hypothetical protein
MHGRAITGEPDVKSFALPGDKARLADNPKEPVMLFVVWDRGHYKMTAVTKTNAEAMYRPGETVYTPVDRYVTGWGIRLNEGMVNRMWHGDGYTTRGSMGYWDGETSNTGYEIWNIEFVECTARLSAGDGDSNQMDSNEIPWNGGLLVAVVVLALLAILTTVFSIYRSQPQPPRGKYHARRLSPTRQHARRSRAPSSNRMVVRDSMASINVPGHGEHDEYGLRKQRSTCPFRDVRTSRTFLSLQELDRGNAHVV